MPDEDIMDQLKEIDDDEILSQEVDPDADLDLDGLDDLDGPSAAAPPRAPAVAPPAPRTAASSGKAKTEKEKLASKRSKSKQPKASTDAVAQVEISAESVAPVAETEADEVVVRAKTLRIVADKVIIEMGGNISFS